MKDHDKTTDQPATARHRPFRRAVLRGLAVVLPPLLTIVIFLWVWNTIQEYVLHPIEAGARQVIVWYVAGELNELPSGIENTVVDEKGRVVAFEFNQRPYVALNNGQWIPRDVFDPVAKDPGPEPPTTALGIYRRYVDIRYLKRYVVIPVFLCVFILVLYLLGKFLAAGLGRIIWNAFEQIIHRLPLIRNVYGSVKQVTDFVFTEREIEFTRVVAVEYPRKGIWSLGFVTGDSMLDIRSAANEPVLSVLIPTSPMPATGFTITVKKSETVDLNLTVDQAIQFIVSCGVVIPATQQAGEIRQEVNSAIARHISENSHNSETKSTTGGKTLLASQHETVEGSATD